MICLQIKCTSCGHYGAIYRIEVVMRFQADENPGVRCGRCGERKRLEIRRAYNPGVNALDGARDDRER